MGASALRSRAVAVPYGLARRHSLAGRCPAALFDALMSTSRLPFRSVNCSCPAPLCSRSRGFPIGPGAKSPVSEKNPSQQFVNKGNVRLLTIDATSPLNP
jgi:hypothetical protein